MKHTLIGKSKAIKSIVKQINRISAKKDDVLIIGERGCGKSVVADNIHHTSSNGNESFPLVEVKLSKIDENDLKTVLFGYEDETPGLSASSRNCLATIANGGTILFEEIDSTSLQNQKIILSFLNQLRGLRSQRNGVEGNVRVIITIKNDPAKLREKDQIIDELANTLSSFTRLFVPPLRERKDDIPHLVEHFVVEACEKIGIQEPVLDINAISILIDQPWKNNIRELKSVIERSVLFSTSGTFTLPQELLDGETKVTKMLESILTGDGEEISGSLDTIERSLIGSALNRFNNNFMKAAEFLGMNKKTLEDRATELGLVRTEK